MHRILLAVVLVVVVAIAIWCAPASQPPDHTIPHARVDEWSAQLREPTIASFAREEVLGPDGGTGAETERVLDLETIGPLPPDSLAKLHRYLAKSGKGKYNRLMRAMEAPGSGPDGAKSSADISRELAATVAYLKIITCQDLVAKGEYWAVIADGPRRDPPLPDGYDFVTITSMHKQDGRDVDVVIPIKLGDYPDIKSAREDMLMMRSRSYTESSEEFNRLPLEERRKRISQHRELVAEARRIKQDPSLSNEAKATKVRALQEQMLPWWLTPDGDSWTKVRLPRAR